MKRGMRHNWRGRGRANVVKEVPVPSSQHGPGPSGVISPPHSNSPHRQRQRQHASVTDSMASLHVTDEGFLGKAGAGDQKQAQQQPQPVPEIQEEPVPTDEEHLPDCRSVGPGCGCTTGDDLHRIVNRHNAPGPGPGFPHYVKDSMIPITTGSLKESVVALTHQSCILCLKQTPTYQCRGCYRVSYCSDKHQREHWPIHSAICTPLMAAKKMEGEQLGIPSTMTMVRDVNKNTVLIQTCADMQAPIDKRLLKRVTGTDLCLSCCGWFRIIAPPNGNGGRCSKCRWPVCGYGCEKDPRHADYECKILTKNHARPLDIAPLMYDAILALRCLLLKIREPKTFDQLVALRNISQIKERSLDALHDDNRLVRFLLESCKLRDILQVDEDFVLTFLKTVEFCTLIMPEFPLTVSRTEVVKGNMNVVHKMISVRYVFAVKNKFTEDCSPNTRWVLRYGTSPTDCYLRLISNTNIMAEEDVTVCWYTDSEFGSLARRRIHNRRFSTACFCSRCVDSTENGSEFGTFLCRECVDPNKSEPIGYLRPCSPLDNESYWTCSNENCTSGITANQASTKLAAILKEVESIKENRHHLFEFITQNVRFLHTNHYLMVRAKHYYVSSVISEMRVSRFEAVRLKDITQANGLVDDLIDLHKLITPGDSIMLGRLYFQRQMLTAVEEIREELLHEYNHIPRVPRIDIPRLFLDLRITQLEAYNILKDDQEGTQNSEWAKLLKRIIEESDILYLHRRGEDPFGTEQIQQLRMIHSCLTGEPESELFGFLEDPEIFNFKLSQNHIPPLTQIHVTRLA